MLGKKLILLALAVVVLMAGEAQACRWRGPVRYRTRWSMHTQGLISGDLYYNPNAFGFGKTGLVPGDVRYSPYAFSFEHPSGLVRDNGISYTTEGCIYYPPGVIEYRSECRRISSCARRTNPQPDFDEMVREWRIKQEARRNMIRSQLEARKESREKWASDGMNVISRFLNDKGVEFKLANSLSMDGETLSAVFLIGRESDDQYVIIYWNLEGIGLLPGKEKWKKTEFLKYLAGLRNEALTGKYKGMDIHPVFSGEWKGSEELNPLKIRYRHEIRPAPYIAPKTPFKSRGSVIASADFAESN